MLFAILLLLFIFWLMGYGPFVALHLVLFKFNGFSVTLWDIFIFFVLIWLIDVLPRPIREIAIVFVLLWVLSLLGIIALAGLSSLLLIAIIVGVLLYALGT